LVFTHNLVVMRMCNENLLFNYFIGSSNAPKKKWEDSEVKAVERHMIKFIKTCKVPGKQDCERCIHAEPESLKQRTWTGVKNYLWNRIMTLKRKGGL